MIICDINVEGGEKVASSDPSSITFQKMDVTRTEDWKAVLDLALSKHGKVDILVNNAGTTYKNKVRSIYLSSIGSLDPQWTDDGLLTMR